MGSLRFILAFTVLDIHARITGRPLVGGETAVQMFFVISGFYMAMILHETYVPGRTTLREFWLSRGFRVFPAYYLVLLLTVLLGAAQLEFGLQLMPPIDAWRGLLSSGHGFVHAVSLSFAQLTLLGLDAFHWLAFGPQGRIQFTAHFWQESSPVWRTLLLPQSWTLSLELYFYLLAPFLVRRSLNLILSIMVASVGVRLIAALGLGLSADPWSYRFFPFELVFFLAGVVAYRLAKTDGAANARHLIQCLVIGTLAVAAFMSRVDTGGLSKLVEAALTAALFAGIAALFRRTRSNMFDRFVGDLSYPLYVSHVLIASFVGANRWLIAASSIGAAIIIYVCVDRPIDAWRHRRFAHSSAA
jgi:peptidoglycan/LPS O-acetylase OafA/YrhL